MFKKRFFAARFGMNVYIERLFNGLIILARWELL